MYTYPQLICLFKSSKINNHQEEGIKHIDKTKNKQDKIKLTNNHNNMLKLPNVNICNLKFTWQTFLQLQTPG